MSAASWLPLRCHRTGINDSVRGFFFFFSFLGRGGVGAGALESSSLLQASVSVKFVCLSSSAALCKNDGTQIHWCKWPGSCAAEGALVFVFCFFFTLMEAAVSLRVAVRDFHSLEFPVLELLGLLGVLSSKRYSLFSRTSSNQWGVMLKTSVRKKQ